MFADVGTTLDVHLRLTSLTLLVPVVSAILEDYAKKMLMNVLCLLHVGMEQLARTLMVLINVFVLMGMKVETVLSIQMTVLHVSFYITLYESSC